MSFFHVWSKLTMCDLESLQAFELGQGLQCVFLLDDYLPQYDFLDIRHVGYGLGVHLEYIDKSSCM